MVFWWSHQITDLLRQNALLIRFIAVELYYEDVRILTLKIHFQYEKLIDSKNIQGESNVQLLWNVCKPLTTTHNLYAVEFFMLRSKIEHKIFDFHLQVQQFYCSCFWELPQNGHCSLQYMNIKIPLFQIYIKHCKAIPCKWIRIKWNLHLFFHFDGAVFAVQYFSRINQRDWNWTINKFYSAIKWTYVGFCNY